MTVEMPPAEVEVTPALVSALIEEQRPDLAHLEVADLAHGWDNFSFRVGADLVARLPRRAVAVDLVANESRWLPTLAERLPLPVPVPVFVGEPGHGYPWPWTLVTSVPGRPAAISGNLDLPGCAHDLGSFLRSLHQPAPEEAPKNPFRGIPLTTRDETTRERIDRIVPKSHAPRVHALWRDALVPTFGKQPVWVHGDLHPNNLLVTNRRISGVIDFGDITSGDPAVDLAVSWMLFPDDAVVHFKDAYGGFDENTWVRARGWAISLALAWLAHSKDNPIMHSIGAVTLDRLNLE